MLPDIGVFHPQVVHFVIALLIAGVVFRLVSLTGKLTFTGPAAAVLLLAGTLAATNRINPCCENGQKTVRYVSCGVMIT